MKIVSECCKASIVEGTAKEYPLGGLTWSQSFKVDVCEVCGEEAASVEVCDCCGEEPDARGLIETELGDYCHVCYWLEVERRFEEVRAAG